MIINEGIFTNLLSIGRSFNQGLKLGIKVISGKYDNSDDMVKSLSEATQGVLRVSNGDLTSSHGEVTVDFNESYTAARLITPYKTTSMIYKSDFVPTNPEISDVISYYKYISHLYEVLQVIANNMPDQDITTDEVFQMAQERAPQDYVVSGSTLKSNDNESVVITGSTDSFDISLKTRKTSVSGDYKKVVTNPQIAKELEVSSIMITIDKLVPFIQKGLRTSPDANFYRDTKSSIPKDDQSPKDDTPNGTQNDTEDKSKGKDKTTQLDNPDKSDDKLQTTELTVTNDDTPEYIQYIQSEIRDALNGSSSVSYNESAHEYTISGKLSGLPDRYRPVVLRALSSIGIEWFPNSSRIEGDNYVIDGRSEVYLADIMLQVDNREKSLSRNYKLIIKEDK